jgi:hypothetical protein
MNDDPTGIIKEDEGRGSRSCWLAEDDQREVLPMASAWLPVH